MKRDMEVVRLILQALEGDEESRTKLKDRPRKECAYNAALMIDAGLVIGEVSHDAEGEVDGYAIARMTWAGHEFLDSVRDDTLWKKAREHVLKPGASWTFDLLKEWAKHEIQQRLGLPIQ